MCPKCGGLSWTVIREGGSEWKHCLCGKAWDFRDRPTDYFHKQISIPLKSRGRAVTVSETENGSKVRFRCKLCTWGVEPGSQYCKRHPDGERIVLPRGPKKTEGLAVKEEAVPPSPPAPAPEPVTITGAPEFILQAIAFLEGRIAEYERDVLAIKQTIETLQKVS